MVLVESEIKKIIFYTMWIKMPQIIFEMKKQYTGKIIAWLLAEEE